VVGELPSEVAAQSRPKKAQGETSFSCRVAKVTDGDTLRCADGTRVRLAGIDAPEITPCKQGRRCVSGDAQASRRVLASLAADETITCRRVGTSYSRAVAFCSSQGVDLSCALVRNGYAVKRYSEQDKVCR
jgi:endonuclease YncB( thermonuclease family)